MPDFGAPPSQGPGAQVAPPPTMPELRWWRVFPGEERQVSVVRRWLAGLLPECPARDDVAAVATELAGNAVRHTASGRGGYFAVEVTWQPSAVRVAVADHGTPSAPRLIDDPVGEHGRGLLVVRGLSARTGVAGDHRGRLVWADVPWAGEGAVEPRSSPAGYEAAIHDGETALARRFTGIPAWFGRSTLAWWALAGNRGLITARSARELAGLLDRLLGEQPPTPSSVPKDTPPAEARGSPANPMVDTCRESRPTECAPWRPVPGVGPSVLTPRLAAPAYSQPGQGVAPIDLWQAPETQRFLLRETTQGWPEAPAAAGSATVINAAPGHRVPAGRVDSRLRTVSSWETRALAEAQVTQDICGRASDNPRPAHRPALPHPRPGPHRRRSKRVHPRPPGPGRPVRHAVLRRNLGSRSGVRDGRRQCRFVWFSVCRGRVI